MPTTRSEKSGEKISRKRSSDTTVIESGSKSFDHPMNTQATASSLSSAASFGSHRPQQYDIDGHGESSDRDLKPKHLQMIQRPKLRVRIKKYHGVAHWTWNCGEDDDVCGICQSAYEGVAPGAKFPGDECPVVWGKCGHSFHIQCVTTWLTTKSTCPFCRVEWEFGANTNE